MWEHIKHIWDGIKATKIDVSNKIEIHETEFIIRDSGLCPPLSCIGNI